MFCKYLISEHQVGARTIISDYCQYLRARFISEIVKSKNTILKSLLKSYFASGLGGLPGSATSPTVCNLCPSFKLHIKTFENVSIIDDH